LAEPTKRGLILKNDVREEQSYGLREPTGSLGRRHLGLSRQPLQPHLLLWDRIAAPTGMNLDHEPSDDEQFLVDCGVLTRHHIQGESGEISIEMRGQSDRDARIEQLRLFSRLDAQEPGCWAVDSAESESIPDLLASPGRSILVRLHRAIPVPDRTTPLEDVFRFVEHRKSEQLALRTHLDGLYLRIGSAGDGPLAFETEMTRLKSAIADELAVLEETPFRIGYAGLAAKMKWEFDPRAAMTAATGAGIVAGVEAALAAAFFGLLGNLIPKIEFETGAEVLRGARTGRPFEYVVQMHRDL